MPGNLAAIVAVVMMMPVMAMMMAVSDRYDNLTVGGRYNGESKDGGEETG